MYAEDQIATWNEKLPFFGRFPGLSCFYWELIMETLNG